MRKYQNYGDHVAAVRSLGDQDKLDALERREADRAKAIQMRMLRRAKYSVRDDEEFLFTEEPDMAWTRDPM